MSNFVADKLELWSAWDDTGLHDLHEDPIPGKSIRSICSIRIEKSFYLKAKVHIVWLL